LTAATRRPGSLSLWVLAAACVGWGIVLLVRPSDMTSTVARLIGIGLVLLGGSFLVRAGSAQRPRLDLIDEWTWLGIGVVALMWPWMVRQGAVDRVPGLRRCRSPRRRPRQRSRRQPSGDLARFSGDPWQPTC
jgi:hypothetical protein